MEQSGNLQWMIEEGWKRDLQVNTLPAQLQECLPELHLNLVGGLEHFLFSPILGIIIPID